MSPLGFPQYHSLAPMYYRGAAAAIVVYSITDQVRALPGAWGLAWPIARPQVARTWSVLCGR